MRKSISIGRAPESSIRIDQRWDKVSNRHADIERDGDRFILYDHSTNGTVVGGVTVHNGNMRIYPGQRIVLAKQYELDWDTIYSYLPNTSTDPVINPSRQTARHNTPVTPSNPVTTDPPQRRRSNYDIDGELRKWNWGAFLLGWVWCVGHKIYWPILFLIIPIIGPLCCSIYLGVKGSRLVWDKTDMFNGDIEAFKRNRHNWNVAGLVVLIVVFVLYFIIGLSSY